MKQVRDVLQLHSVMNLSLRRIQGATNVAKSTISDYIKRFNDSGLNIEQINILDDDALKMKYSPTQGCGVSLYISNFNCPSCIF